MVISVSGIVKSEITLNPGTGNSSKLNLELLETVEFYSGSNIFIENKGHLIAVGKLI